jgi:hypothetical protein
MRKLEAHYDTLGVLVVLCPLAGVGAGLAFASTLFGVVVAIATAAVVSRLGPGRALWAEVRTTETPPSLTDLALSRVAENDGDRNWSPPLWDPDAKIARRTAELTH